MLILNFKLTDKHHKPEKRGSTVSMKEHTVSPAPSPTPPPAEEDTQELIAVNEHTEELDLNHGRIGKIENLENLVNLER